MPQIFECDEITLLVEEWQDTQDTHTLEQILEGSRRLIEAIVSSFDYRYRNDLIQESYAKIIYALPFFNKDIANLHTFLTTVIRNVCVTFINKERKIIEIPEDYDISADADTTKIDTEDILTELIIRNRRRFPSIPVDILDDMTEFIFMHVIDSTSKWKTVSLLCNNFKCSKSTASVVYHSSLIYVRYKYKNYISDLDEWTNNELEFSLLPDIEEVFGSNVLKDMYAIFSGVYMRFP